MDTLPPVFLFNSVKESLGATALVEGGMVNVKIALSREAIKTLRLRQSQNGSNSYDLGMKDPNLCNHRQVLLMQDILEILEVPHLSTVQDILVIFTSLHSLVIRNIPDILDMLQVADMRDMLKVLEILEIHAYSSCSCFFLPG